MKLLAKTSIYYLIFSALLFSVVGIIFYDRLQGVIDEEYTENLYLEKDVIIKFMNDSGKIPLQQLYIGDNVIFIKTNVFFKEHLGDTNIYNSLEDEMQLTRRLVFPAEAGGQKYKVIINKSLFESEDLVENIAYPFALSAFFTMIILFVFTWVQQKQMWKPFYSTLGELNSFDAKQNNSLNLPETKTLEFRTLNSEIKKMTDKIRNDYKNLKEFTENASHEMQTPLSIIRSKMELMIQSEELTKVQTESIMDMFTSLTRLSKLNQSLLLLSKIENGQFGDNQMVSVENILKDKLGLFEEMIKFRKISVVKQINFSPFVKVNPQLADILFSNLLNNAIKHNIYSGKIIIELNKDSIIISNSGIKPLRDPENMFERFSKESTSGDSAGLGLAISKKICDASGFKITYKYSDNLHIITIIF
ncbi:MAG: HAMP domain-containing sensor histidine kinase [Ignavibacteria bacterium]